MSVSRRPIITMTGLAIVMVVAVSIYGRVRFGSLSRAFAYAMGARPFAEPATRTLGELPAESEQRTWFALTNWTGHPVELLGSKSGCSCAMVEELPSRLEAFQTLRVRIRILVPKEGQGLSGMVKVFTDEPGYPQIGFSYSGAVVASGSAVATGSH